MAESKRRYVGVLLDEATFQEVVALAKRQGSSSMSAAARKLLMEGIARLKEKQNPAEQGG